ncbi:MAG: outer membrane beta-barrel protein [Paraprevotella sp.]|nr:outer membrane beta-barrel protein [Paraprevotella sp.]
MKNKFLLLLLTLFAKLCGYAQADTRYDAGGKILDISTNKFIVEGTKIELLTMDSVVIDTTSCKWYSKYQTSASFTLPVPTGDGNYLIRISHPDYHTVVKKLWKLRRNYTSYDLGNVFLERIPPMPVRELGEVNIKASRIKFYVKGDTLVYNADAFNLPEGSMLDALIERLPGVEMKSDGRIYVNGKFVESLMLNGRDFFKGNNRIMLDNLPAYTVKDVKVYDKYGELSELTGTKKNDASYVMDINLKRQYQIGWMANAEIGGGTEDRWMARLFALRFTPHSRLTLFGNSNNINDNRKPGSMGNVQTNVGPGLLTTYDGGLDYDINDNKRGIEFQGDVHVTHLSEDNRMQQNLEYFQTGGSSFGRKWQQASGHSTSVTTKHGGHWWLMERKMSVWLKPDFSWQNRHNRFYNIEAEFTSDPKEILALKDSLAQPDIGTYILKTLVNRIRSQARGNGYDMKGNIFTSLYYAIPHINDAIGLTVQGGFDKHTSHLFDDYRLDMAGQGTTDYRHRFTESPSHGYYLQGHAFYSTRVEHWDFNLSYNIKLKHNKQEYSLYRLDQLAGGNDESGLTELPSSRETLSDVLDISNSYHTTTSTTDNNVNLEIRYETEKEHNGKKSDWLLLLTPSLTVRHERLQYNGATHHKKHRTRPMPRFQGNLKRRTPGLAHQIEFTYDAFSSLPSMMHLLGLRFDNDPLNIREGNTGLKTTWEQKVGLKYNSSQWYKKYRRMLSANANIRLQHNAVATGYIYNKETGVRTYRPENINGNWNTSANVAFSTPLDKQKHLELKVNMTEFYYHSVDLIGVEGGERATKSTVHTSYLQMPVSLDYSKNDWRIGAKVHMSWHYATSHRTGFETVNAADLHYGITGQTKLPWNIQLASDLTYYCRYGYTDSAMNTQDFVWNAQLSKSVLRGNLLFTLVGFDILGQLSNITYSLNSQGRTETWRNVIPRYGMLRIIYKLNKQPKKK